MSGTEPLKPTVIDFIMTEGAYYFIIDDGRRADVIKARSLQPSIENPDHYRSYLWVIALQGGFLLSQEFRGGQSESWQVEREIPIPEEKTPEWFDETGDALLKELEAEVGG